MTSVLRCLDQKQIGISRTFLILSSNHCSYLCHQIRLFARYYVVVEEKLQPKYLS